MPLSDPTTAVIRALIEAAANPSTTFSPYIRAMIDRAPKIVSLVELTTPDVLLDRGAFDQEIERFVRRTTQGEKRFGGWTLIRLHTDIVERAHRARATKDRAGQALATCLQQDSRSVALTFAGLGGRSEPLRTILLRQLEAECIEYRYTVSVQRLGEFDNCLHYLVVQKLDGWR